MKRFILGVGAVLILQYAISKTAESVTNSFEVNSVKYDDVVTTILNTKFDLLIDFKNGNSVGASITKIDVKLYYNDEDILQIVSTDTTQVDANSDVTLVLEAVLNHLEFAQDIVNIIQSGSLFPNLVAKGTITSNGIDFPFEKNLLKLG